MRSEDPSARASQSLDFLLQLQLLQGSERSIWATRQQYSDLFGKGTGQIKQQWRKQRYYPALTVLFNPAWFCMMNPDDAKEKPARWTWISTTSISLNTINNPGADFANEKIFSQKPRQPAASVGDCYSNIPFTTGTLSKHSILMPSSSTRARQKRNSSPWGCSCHGCNECIGLSIMVGNVSDAL